MSYAVAIVSPRRPTRAVTCSGLDQCLEVIASEGPDAETGSTLTIFRVAMEQMFPVTTWRKTRTGLSRRRV